MSTLQVEEIATLFAVKLPPRPYPGLRPFEKDEWPIFFGRERMADAVVAQLLEKRVLMVHGESGCGKSSLVRAAVLPKLEQENARGGIRWRTCSFLPREAPVWNFARALADLDPGSGEDHLLQLRRALNGRREAPKALAELLRLRPGDQVCILIDQFEELFEHARRHGPEDAQMLTEALIGLFNDPPDGLYAILTMRSEFLGACARFKDFAEMVNDAQYLLPAMGHEDLLRAICEPATLYGGEVSRQLAERLITETGGSQDQLPLVQHGLMLLHRERPAASQGAWQLTLDNYGREKKLAGLISDHADAVMLKALAGLRPEHSRLVEDIFRALTELTEGRAIRRPRTLRQLAGITGADEAAVRHVVDAFRADGVSFLTPYGSAPLESGDLIDVSHEALLRCWNALAEPVDGWLAREARNGLVWRSLLVQAESFERDSTAVLSASTTAEREQWMRRRNEHWAERHGGGWERVRNLMAASTAARERDERKARHHKFLVRATAVASLALVILVLVIQWQWQAAETRFERERAQIEAERARYQRERARSEAEMSERLAQQTQQIADQIQKTLAQLDRATLDKTKAELKTEVSNLQAAAVLPARVYVHISEESQREAARAFEQALKQHELGGAKIVVPSIQLVKGSPPRSELRCFHAEECTGETRRLADIANGLLLEPKLKIFDLSERYRGSTAIRARHYELWFAPGPISLQHGSR